MPDLDSCPVANRRGWQQANSALYLFVQQVEANQYPDMDEAIRAIRFLARMDRTLDALPRDRPPLLRRLHGRKSLDCRDLAELLPAFQMESNTKIQALATSKLEASSSLGENPT